MQSTPRGRRWRDRVLARARGHPSLLLRRLLAVSLLLSAAVIAAMPVKGEPGDTVLVTSRDLALGATLTATDVRVVPVPGSLRPRGALTSPSQVVGRRLIGRARAGELLTDARLAGIRPNRPGTATVPVRLADRGITDLLQPGTTVDVVAPGDGESGGEVLAGMATVLRVVGRSGSGRAGHDPENTGPLVLLSVPTGKASRLAAGSLGRPVTVTLR
jgi:Flp pilus assembly protein CpaB